MNEEEAGVAARGSQLDDVGPTRANPTGRWKPRVLGGLVGLLLGGGLLGWALAVDAIRFGGGSDVDVCNRLLPSNRRSTTLYPASGNRTSS